MGRDIIAMDRRERDISKVIEQVVRERILQKEGARDVQLSVRQFRRMQRRYEEEGDEGLIHRLRGQTSKRKTDKRIMKKAIRLMRDKYNGFGPTLGSEYLAEEEAIEVSRETLRGWMVGEGLWKDRREKVKHRQWRERRSCEGELEQMDTSIHDWLEGRGKKIVLIHMIDDASSNLFARFYAGDSTKTNMGHIKAYIETKGLPRGIYADKASHFKTTRKASIEEDLKEKEAQTQIQRALEELGIELIPAHSPQAKGRVERSFGTAQDRLVKALRLANAKTEEEANEVLEKKFMPVWQKRFTIKPKSPVNMHRTKDRGIDLDAILSVQCLRTVANDYTVQYKTRRFQILRESITSGLRRHEVLLEDRLDGSIHLRFRNKYLAIKEIAGTKGVEDKNSMEVLSRPRTYINIKTKVLYPQKKRTFLLCRKGDISILR